MNKHTVHINDVIKPAIVNNLEVPAPSPKRLTANTVNMYTPASVKFSTVKLLSVIWYSITLPVMLWASLYLVIGGLEEGGGG